MASPDPSSSSSSSSGLPSWLSCARLGFPRDSERASTPQPQTLPSRLRLLGRGRVSPTDTSRMSQEGQAAHRPMFRGFGTFPLRASVS